MSDEDTHSEAHPTSYSSPEEELMHYLSESPLVEALRQHIPPKVEFPESPTSPAFWPTAGHHQFFEDQTAASSCRKRTASSGASSRRSRTPETREPYIKDDRFAFPSRYARSSQMATLLWGCGDELPLYNIIDIPHWQRFNPAIRGGYRAFYNTSMTFKSMLGWHNETVNVWSHFVGFLFFLYLTVLLFRTVLISDVVSSRLLFCLDHAPVFYCIFCFGCMGCTVCSAGYHLFNGHRDCRIMTLMGRIDFIGITFLIIASFLPPLYMLLHCFPYMRRIYITTAITLGLMASGACWSSTFFDSVKLRVAVFVSLAVSGVTPLIHAFFSTPFTPPVLSIIYGIELMLALYGTGVLIYASRFPEAWFPSHFDCFLSSHQLWHYFVLLAAIVHFFNCTSMYQMHTMSDTC